jgi:hypothetical protein
MHGSESADSLCTARRPRRGEGTEPPVRCNPGAERVSNFFPFPLLGFYRITRTATHEAILKRIGYMRILVLVLLIAVAAVAKAAANVRYRNDSSWSRRTKEVLTGNPGHRRTQRHRLLDDRAFESRVVPMPPLPRSL